MVNRKVGMGNRACFLWAFQSIQVAEVLEQ